MSVVFITGAAKNTGFAIAGKFAAEGYDVAISGRNGSEAENAAEKIKERYGVKAKGYALSLTDVGEICTVFKHIKEDFERLDCFIANAANLGIGKDIFTADEKSYDEIMDVNVKGTFFCCREAAKLMAKNGGSIVIIGSVQSKGAIEGRCLYGVSKAAVNALNKYIAYDLAPYGIRSNCIIAGAIHTVRWEGLDEETLRRRRENYPLQRESDMEDIANGAYYLGTDLSKTVTGTELVIDSGVLVPLLPYKDRKNLTHPGFDDE